MANKFYIDGPRKPYAIRRREPSNKKTDGRKSITQPAKRSQMSRLVHVYAPHFKHILIPIDLSSHFHAHLHLGTSLAFQYQAATTLIAVIAHVSTKTQIPYISHQAEIDLINLREEFFPPELYVETRVCLGDPAEKILREAKKVGHDLIVMGTHGRKGLAHFVLGSVAEKVLRKTPCAVLTVRGNRHSMKR